MHNEVKWLQDTVKAAKRQITAADHLSWAASRVLETRLNDGDLAAELATLYSAVKNYEQTNLERIAAGAQYRRSYE